MIVAEIQTTKEIQEQKAKNLQTSKGLPATGSLVDAV